MAKRSGNKERVSQPQQEFIKSSNGLSAYFERSPVELYRGDALKIIRQLPDEFVDCVVSSPPYYGQRDYGVKAQIGLELQPQAYIQKLVNVFSEVKRILKPGGSVWVNIGDTYWSGKGRSHGVDKKQKNRRFLRPQDRTGVRPLCTPKQLLLIPHRFAIAMQEAGWIVRNDNIWNKMNPTPDPTRDRSSSSHEYVFHFVKSRRYYYNFKKVAVPSNGQKKEKSPASVWNVATATNFKKHIAVFPPGLIRIPVLSSLPKKGVLLDPFCGSGTALEFALEQKIGKRLIGIDVSPSALIEAKELLSKAMNNGN